jgi:hypothetical protein
MIKTGVVSNFPLLNIRICFEFRASDFDIPSFASKLSGIRAIRGRFRSLSVAEFLLRE